MVSVRNMVPSSVRHCIMDRSIVLSPETSHTWHKSADGVDSDRLRVSGVGVETMTSIIVIGGIGAFRVSHLKERSNRDGVGYTLTVLVRPH